jgi:tRNA A37 threonylcarbamoyltransferase TsaD
MSFSFQALGTKAEVIAQIEKASVYDNAIGETAKELVINALKADTTEAGKDYEYRYVVSAGGHSGGGTATSLQLAITPQYVPVIK